MTQTIDDSDITADVDSDIDITTTVDSDNVEAECVDGQHDGPAAASASTTMEEYLAGTERAVESALRSAGATVSVLKRTLAGARTGQIRDLRKSLAAAHQAAAALAEQVTDLQQSLDFDEQAYMASGAYAQELLALAQDRGVAMFQGDDLLLCYPSLVRVLSADAAVEIDKTRERRLRPSLIMAQLASNQDKTPRFKIEPFLDAMRTAYELLILRDDKKSDGVVRLVEIWQILTLLPQGGKYSKQEFARDLYLLDQSAIISTSRSSRQLRWSASTGTKGSGVLVTVSRSGQQQRYWGISFTLPEIEAEA